MFGKSISRLGLLAIIALTTVACSTSSANYYSREDRSERNPNEYRRPIGQSVSYYDGYNEYFDPHYYHRPKPKKFKRDGYTRYDTIRSYEHDPRDLDKRLADERDDG